MQICHQIAEIDSQLQLPNYFAPKIFQDKNKKKTLKQRKPNQLGAHLILQHNAYCIMNAEENLKEKHTHNQLYICINVHILV